MLKNIGMPETLAVHLFNQKIFCGIPLNSANYQIGTHVSDASLRFTYRIAAN